ncbi:MAG: hypothetical protein RLY71_2297 [Pseudomonadota bacterium]|jgi:phage terminase small subunit
MLTPKQARFVEEYLVDLNATQAYIRAGYKARGNSAEVNAGRLLRNAQVAEAIQAGRRELSQRTARTVAQVMADIGRVRDDAMQLVTDPDTGSHSMLSHKDALKALELEGKHLGAFADRVELSNPDGSLRPQVIRIVAAPLKGPAIG